MVKQVGATIKSTAKWLWPWFIGYLLYNSASGVSMYLQERKERNALIDSIKTSRSIPESMVISPKLNHQYIDSTIMYDKGLSANTYNSKETLYPSDIGIIRNH